MAVDTPTAAVTRTPAPGLSLGPMEVDRAGELTGKVGLKNQAKQLLKAHANQFPAGMTKTLSMPEARTRTEALDLEEVEDALLSLRGRKAFFEDGDRLEGASVRGHLTPSGDVLPGQEDSLIVSVVYRKPPVRGDNPDLGRSATGFIPYAGLDRSLEAYEEAERARRSGGGAAIAVAGDEDAQDAIRAAESARRDAEESVEELRERLEALEDPEPWEGYAEEPADAVAEKVKDGGHIEFGRAGLERIESYESRHKDRSTVLKAVAAAIDAIPPSE